LTGVTFEGDRADRKGALSGGFHDFRQSRLETVMQLRDAQNQVLEGERELHKIREIVRNLEQRLLRIRDELTASELEHRHLVERRQTILRDIQSKTSKARDIENLLHQQGKALQSLTLSVENMMVDKQTAEQELGTPLRKKLNANEQRMLESLPSSIEACKRTLSEIVVQRTKVINVLIFRLKQLKIN
jgi:structural maintenance of chromosome 3 (chondroitin sulfate proteoglycan 6)